MDKSSSADNLSTSSHNHHNRSDETSSLRGHEPGTEPDCAQQASAANPSTSLSVHPLPSPSSIMVDLPSSPATTSPASPLVAMDNHRTQSLQLTSCSPSYVLLNRFKSSTDSKASYIATSTPEIREPALLSTKKTNEPNDSSPVEIRIHKASFSMEGPSPHLVSTTSAPTSISPSFVKSYSGTVAAKLERRRASSNAASSSSAPRLGATLTTGSCVPSYVRRKSWDLRVTGPIRRASQALINLANASGVLSASGDNASTGSIYGSAYGECSRRDSRIRLQEIRLMYSAFQRIPMKDFGAEVRASMDVDQFLQQAVLLLDIAETSLEGIVDRMLRKVMFMPFCCCLCFIDFFKPNSVAFSICQ